MSYYFRITLFFGLIAFGLCGDLTINYFPSSLGFGSAATLRLSDLDDVVASSMGYTTQGTGWRGLSTTNPFKYPSAAVIIGVHSDAAALKQAGVKRYPIKEDSTLEDVYHDMTGVVGARAQRPTYFKHVLANDVKNVTLTEVEGIVELDNSVEPDSSFLHEMMLLPHALHTVKDGSAVAVNGQDFVFIEVESFAAVVKTYGKSSTRVSEATKILLKQLASLESNIRHIYNDNVVIYSVSAQHMDQLSRKTRSLLFTSEDEANLNLANEYSEDYPAIFNIVLILGIILFLAVLATSYSLGFMDPGRDSIIYRMTNPRMKKDQ